MTSDKYLWHVTLDTGDIASSPRSAVSDAAIASVAPHVKRAVANGRDVIPTTACQLMATATGPFLQATILGLGARPILTFGVAPRSREAQNLWDIITDREFAVDIGDMPVAPWLAVRLEPGANSSSTEAWMADYERIVAWAWIEGVAA